jgi:hypothetical protein
MLKDKPEYLQDDNFVNNLYEDLLKDKHPRKTLKMLQVTDIHLDLKYRAGASNDCRSAICCRAEYGFPRQKAKQAGPLGDYHCDIPIDTITSMGEYVKE